MDDSRRRNQTHREIVAARRAGMSDLVITRPSAALPRTHASGVAGNIVSRESASLTHGRRSFEITLWHHATRTEFRAVIWASSIDDVANRVRYGRFGAGLQLVGWPRPTPSTLHDIFSPTE